MIKISYTIIVSSIVIFFFLSIILWFTFSKIKGESNSNDTSYKQLANNGDANLFSTPTLYEVFFERRDANDKTIWVFKDASKLIQDVLKGRANILLIDDVFYKAKYTNSTSLKLTPITEENNNNMNYSNMVLHLLAWQG